MKCPYCEKEKCIPDVVINNAEMYNQEWYYPRCLHCNKVIRVRAVRRVVIVAIEKTDKEEGDWG